MTAPQLLRPLRVRDFRLYTLAGAIADLGQVPLMFGVAGAIVVAASLSGLAAGVAGQMTYASEAEAVA
jgi:hypothetical protein